MLEDKKNIENIITSKINEILSESKADIYKTVNDIINSRLQIDESKILEVEKIKEQEEKKAQEMLERQEKEREEQEREKDQHNENETFYQLKNDFFEAMMTDDEEYLEDVKLRYQEYIEDQNKLDEE